MQIEKFVVHHSTYGVGTVQRARPSDDGNHVVLRAKFSAGTREVYADPQYWLTPEAELLRIAESLLPVIPHSEPKPERTPVCYRCPDCGIDFEGLHSHPWTGNGQVIEGNNSSNRAPWRCIDCRKTHLRESSIVRSKAYRQEHKDEAEFKAGEAKRKRIWRVANLEHERERKRQARRVANSQRKLEGAFMPSAAQGRADELPSLC
jgi:hypothetical protein